VNLGGGSKVAVQQVGIARHPVVGNHGSVFAGRTAGKIDVGEFTLQVIPNRNKTDGFLPFMLPSTH
jgi:hypothetical protein